MKLQFDFIGIVSLCGLAFCVVMLIVTIADGYRGHVTRAIQAEAIEAGAGEWKINPKTGERRFEFLKRE